MDEGQDSLLLHFLADMKRKEATSDAECQQVDT
jgi:hypothetical protein